MIAPLGTVNTERGRVKSGYLDGLDPLSGRILDSTPLRSPANIEAIARASGAAIGEVVAAMGNLEMEGRVIQVAGKWKKAGV